MPGHGVHHVVYATRDVEATRHFYEDLMGFPLSHAEVQEHGEARVERSRDVAAAEPS